MTFIEPAIEQFAYNHTKPESELLHRLYEETQSKMIAANMMIGRITGQLLKTLISISGARTVLEIGMFTGYSALTMAEALPSDGRLITCELSPEAETMAKRYFDQSPHGYKIDIRMGYAIKTVQSLTEEFDLVFIDADKGNYINYYEVMLPKLKPGGLIVADNVLWSGKVLAPNDVDTQSIVAFNEHVQNDPRVENVCLTVRDGIMLIRKCSY